MSEPGNPAGSRLYPGKIQVQEDQRLADEQYLRTDGIFLTEKELAKRWAISVKKLQKDRLIGGGVPYLKINRVVRYRLSEVECWEHLNTRESSSKK